MSYSRNKFVIFLRFFHNFYFGILLCNGVGGLVCGRILSWKFVGLETFCTLIKTNLLKITGKNQALAHLPQQTSMRNTIKLQFCLLSFFSGFFIFWCFHVIVLLKISLCTWKWSQSWALTVLPFSSQLVWFFSFSQVKYFLKLLFLKHHFK